MKINSSCTRNELWLELYKHYAGSYGLHGEEKRCKDLRYNGKQVDYLDYGGIRVDNQYIPRNKIVFEYLSIENGEEKKMNRREIKKELENIADEVEALADEVESTRDEIEPYDGKDELTEQQEERYEWLDDLCSYLYDLANELRDYE